MTTNALPPFSFAGQGLDRAAHRRADMAWITKALIHDNSAFYLFLDDRIVVDAPPRALFSRSEAHRLNVDWRTALFLGTTPDRGASRFAVRGFLKDDNVSLADVDGYAACRLTDLRSLAMEGGLAPGDLSALATAQSLFSWHQSHRFCARCGQPSEMTEAGWRRDCISCAAQHFPRTDPTVIMLIVDGDRCLLGNHARLADNMWTTLAGFMEPGETIEQAVRREVREEAGIEVGAVRYGASQPWPFPTNLMIGCIGTARSVDIRVDPAELEDARWFSRREVTAMAHGTHKENLIIPPALSIAHWLIRLFIEPDTPLGDHPLPGK